MLTASIAFRERIQELSMALARIECESDDPYARELARSVLYQHAQRKPSDQSEAVE